MKEKIRVVAGKAVSGDPEKRFSKEEILNVKSFYEQESHVQPERLKEYHEVFCDGQMEEWFEFVPASYDGSCAVPLVISCHGGGQSGWGQCYATSWTMVAEREGFICVFPTAQCNEHRMWTVNWEGPIDKEGNHDLKFLLALIKRLKGKYRIDEERIFMQGMSMGDLMTMQFCRAYGSLLAGAANVAAATAIESLVERDGSLKEYTVPVPVFQSRGERDNLARDAGYDKEATKYDINKCNLDFWRRINQCKTLPEIRIEGIHNYAFYKGELADVVYHDVKRRGHGQTLDDAELVWSFFFSGLRRKKNGRIYRGVPDEPATGDWQAVAIASGCSQAYVNNQRVSLDEKESVVQYRLQKIEIQETTSEEFQKRLRESGIVFGPYYYVPVAFLEKAFGAVITIEENGRNATIQVEDKEIRIAEGNAGCTVNNRIVCMDAPVFLEQDTLFLSFQWFAKTIMNCFTTEINEVLYVCNHNCEMTNDMSRILRELLSTK